MNLKETLKNYLHKIPAFLSGILLGALLTGAFFIFKLNDYFLTIKNSFSDKVTVIEQKNNDATDEQKQKSQKKSTIKKYPHEKDTVLSENTDNADNTHVVEEKTLSTKTLKIISIEEPGDTLVKNTAEAPDTNPENLLIIEFKQTPFNNKGYYFDNNSLVLYGLQDIPYINIYRLHNDLYLKYDKVVYKLPYVSEFQPLIRVEDVHLLAKLN